MSFSYFGNRDRGGDYDIVYYNADIVNGRTLDRGSGQDPRVNFNETRDSAIIKDASKYYFSIVRFTMNGAGKDLPLFIPIIETDGTRNPTYNINQTIYRITIEATDGVSTYTVQLPVIFQPEDLDAPVPTIPTASNPNQDTSSKYYYVSSYTRFMNMVNQTFEDIFTALNAPARFNGAFQTAPPVMYYDGNTNRFGIRASLSGFTDAAYFAAERCRIFVDSNFHGLFNYTRLY